MLPKHIIAILALPVVMFSACASNPESAEADKQYSAEEILDRADSATFSSDITDMASSSRKVVRTADYKCRVDDVLKATTDLENIVTSVGGIIEESRLENTPAQVKRTSYKRDSLKEVSTYTTTAMLTLRVPVAMVDSVNRIIPQLAAYTEARNISQTDVTLQYLGNSLKSKAIQKSTLPQPVTSDTSWDAMEVARYNMEAETSSIDRRIENLKLADDAAYATIKVDFYQPDIVRTQVIADADALMQASLGQRFLDSLSMGWNAFTSIFLFLLRLWPIVVIAGIIVVVLQRRKRIKMPVGRP